MQEAPVHDNNVYAYQVLCDRRQVILHTEYKHVTPHEFTDVIFSGVVAHYFEDVLSGNILFGVDEVDVAHLVSSWWNLLGGRMKYGWPEGIKCRDQTELISLLKTRGDRAFDISSS